jgi:hypothetical protein
MSHIGEHEVTTSQVTSCIPAAQTIRDMTIDPLDSGRPAQKRWEEFRAQYASALLSHKVFRELRATAQDAMTDLWSRLQSALCDDEGLKELADQEGIAWDRLVPLRSADGGIAGWEDVDELGRVYDSLFPHELQNASLEQGLAAATVVGLHSALESYVRALGAPSKGPLPEAVRRHLRSVDRLVDSELFDQLADLDATRHVIVHNRSIVDERYVRAVRNSWFSLGEFRSIDDRVIDRFADTSSKVADLLRRVDMNEDRSS